jgi:hypothetical protein
MKSLPFILMLLLADPQYTYSATLEIEWEFDQGCTGYRLYQRMGSGSAYDMAHPVWTGAGKVGTAIVSDTRETGFIVTAYWVGELSGEIVESGPSDEAIWTPDEIGIDPNQVPYGIKFKVVSSVIKPVIP